MRTLRHILSILILCSFVQAGQNMIYLDGQLPHATFGTQHTIDIMYIGDGHMQAAQDTFVTWEFGGGYGWDISNPASNSSLSSLVTFSSNNTAYKGMQGYSLYACPTGSSITIPAEAQLFTINAAFALPGLIHIDLWNSQTLKLLDRAVIYNGGGPVSGSSTWIKSIINPNITIEPGKTCLLDGADSLNFGLTQDETIYSWSIDGKGSWTGSAASVDYASIRALGIDPGYHNLTLNMKANAYSTDSYYDEFGYHEGTRHYYDVLSSDTVQIFVPAPEPCSILLLASGLLLCRKKFK